MSMIERGNESELWHIGTATSGRYPKGSGARPYQHGGKGPSGSKYGSKSVKDMTDDELANAVKRQRNEAAYNKMADAEANKDMNDLRGSINNLNQGLQQAYNQSAPRNEKAPIDYRKAEELKDIADKELQQKINRLNMEKQYLTLMQERELKTTKMKQAEYKVHEILGYAVPIASVVGSVAPIAIAIYAARNK